MQDEQCAEQLRTQSAVGRLGRLPGDVLHAVPAGATLTALAAQPATGAAKPTAATAAVATTLHTRCLRVRGYLRPHRQSRAMGVGWTLCRWRPLISGRPVRTRQRL